MTEEWRDVVGYEGLYQVSNFGRIKSLPKYYFGERMLSPTDNGSGYLIVSLTKNEKRKNHYIHRIVAEAFIPNKENKPTVNHKDRDKQNNIISNLEWATFSEQIHHVVATGKKPHAKNYTTSRVIELSPEIISAYEKGRSVTDISRKLSICPQTINKVLNEHGIQIKSSKDFCSVKVECISCVDNKIRNFNSVKDASDWLIKNGFSKTNASSDIIKCCKGKTKTSRGFYWRYV